MREMTPKEIRERAAEVRAQEPMVSKPLEQQILTAWRLESPKMWARLGPDLAKDLALIAQVAMWEACDRYERAGMPPTDAREQAERECLMLEPEEE